MSDLLVTPEIVTTDDGDHDRFAHIVFPKEKLVDALINGTAVVALCGKVWRPGRDPKKYPLCQMCKESAEKSPWEVPTE